MFGFVIGTLCLIALVRLLSRRRWGGYYGHHGHWHGRRYYRGMGPRGALNAVLARLDTAPGQEKVIAQAVSEFIDRARESGREVRATRQGIAEALRSETLDEARLNDVFGQHDAALDEVRKAGVTAARKVHEALDERQRKLLGDLVEQGFHGFHYGHGGFGPRACG